jgi:PAS domain S-box-containing protein
MPPAAEMNLQIPPSLLNMIMRSIDFIYIFNSDINIVAVNYAACRSVGFSQQEMMNMKMYDIDVIYDMSAWQAILKKLRSSGSMRIETMQRSKEGDIFPVEMTLNYILVNGKEYAVGIGRDITERKHIEEALKESETKYRRLIETAGAGMVTVDISGRINYVNQTFCRMTGYVREELLGKLFIDCLHEDDASILLDAFSHTLHDADPDSTLEFRLKHKDGGIIWCSTTPSQLVYEDKLTGFNLILQDITRRKNLEEALKESERKYRAVVEDQLEMICRFVPDGTITFANTAFCRFYGKSSSEIVGKSYLSLLPETQYPSFTAAVEELLTEPDKVIYDIQSYERGGTVRWLEQSLRALTDDSRQVERFQVVLRDITERKRAEHALKESEEQFRMIFNSIHDGFAVFEINYDESDKVVDARFLEVNPAFEKITGTRANDILGKTLWEVFPTMRLSTAQLWKDVITEGKNIRIEEYYSKSLDKYFRVIGLSPKRGRYAVLITDLTERKKMTEKLIRADRLSSLGEMAAGLAHEINNPLTGVIGLSQLMLEKKDLTGSLREDIAAINKEASRASGILKDFLIFARGQKPDMRPADINGVIESVLKMRRTHMKKEGIEVLADFDRSLPPLMIDVAQMQQVILNIILNAEYFMSEAHKGGKLIISTSRQDNIVKIVIQDNGPGITAENLPNIFDPFFTTKESGRGTGLGLSISYGIVSEHGGNIIAESRPGEGARFIIELPSGL